MANRGRPRICPPFFPHFANASKESDTIAALEAEIGADGKPLGNNGYAFWFKLLEMLRSADGMCIDCKIPSNWKRLQARTRLSEDDIKICINVLCTMGAIDPDLWEQQNIIWCEKFLEHLRVAGCKDANVNPPNVVEEQLPEGKHREQTSLGFDVVIDEGWQRVEQAFAEQIGDLPYGDYHRCLQEFYDEMGADVIELAISITNKAQPSNPKTYLLNGVLKKWEERGVKTVDQAQACIDEMERLKEMNKGKKQPMTQVIDTTKWV